MRRVEGIGCALLGFLIGLAGISPAWAARTLMTPEFAMGSGIEMRVTSPYEEIPPLGFLPVRVAVKNRSNAPRTWELESEYVQAGVRRTSFSAKLRVEAGTEKIFDVLVPLQPQFDSYRRYSTLMVSINGYAVTGNRTGEMSSGSRGGTPTPFLGMGEALAVKNWGPLRDNLEKKHSKWLEGTSLDPELMPTDWRALAGFSILLFTDEEWRRIPSTPRAAIQDWVAQGGRLILCSTGSPGDQPAAGRVGSGLIESWPTGEDFLTRAAQALDGGEKSPIEGSLTAYNAHWGTAEKVGQAEPPQMLILGFVLIFGGVVGPLNFLVLAPAGNRHRLFWTTPLISLIASVLLAAFILLSEGFGGKGLRFEALLSLPSEHKEVLWQEQVSRTGILVGNSFTPSEPSLILPLSLRGRRSYREGGNVFALNGTTWSGDWFQNRTTQGQLIATVAPTRGRLEVTAGADGGPVVVSSFEQMLERCWYLDDSRKAWVAEGLAPGEKKVMKSVAPGEYAKEWRNCLDKAGPVIVAAAKGFSEGTPTGQFFAVTKPEPQPISSLSAIRWQSAGGLIFGTPAKR